MRRVTIQPKALAELGDIPAYIGRDNLDAAQRFVVAADDAIRLLAEYPGMGGRVESKNPKFHDLRMWPIKEFRNYLICYHPIEDGIEVYRVIHAAQDVTRIFR